MAVNVGSAIAYLTLDRSGFKNSLHSAGADLKQFVHGTGEIGGRLQGLGGAMSTVGGSLTKAVTLPIIGAGAACAKMASDFETSMAKISTIAGASKQELASMKGEILDASGEMGMAAKDFGEATYQALSSGIGKADAVKFTKDAAVLAKGGFTDVTTATDVLTSTINAYGKSSKDATEISNQLIIAQKRGKTEVGLMGQSLGNVIPIASALGVKTNELFSSIAATTSQGIQTSESITGLKAAMSNIVKPSDQAKKAAEALGMQFDVNAVKSKGWMGFMQDVKSKLESSAPAYAKKLDEVNKLKAAVNSSASASNKYKIAIDKEREKISKLKEEKKALTSKDKDRKKSIDLEVKSMQEHIKTMQSQSKAEKQGVGSSKEMKKELKEKEKELKILEGTSKGTLTAFSTMFGSIEGLNTVMSMTSQGGAKVYNDSMKEMQENTKAAQDAFDKMMNTPEEKFKRAKAQMQKLGITIGGYLLPAIVKFLDAFSKVLDMLNKLPGPIKHTIVSFAGMAAIAGPLLKVGGNVIKLIATVGKIGKIPGLIKKCVSGVLKSFKTLKTGINIFKMLPALITPHTILIVGAIAGIGLIVYEVIKHWGALKKAASSMAKHINNVCKKISTLFKHWIEGWKFIWRGFSGFMCKIGGWICDGLLDGLKKGWERVKNFTGKMASGIKDVFKKVLGINSPSRVFSAYGGFIGEGLIQGLERQNSAITAKFRGLGNKIKGLGNVKPDFSGFMSKTGSWICDGLLGGLKKSWEGVENFTGEMASGIKDIFKKVLGINSPSRVFSAYGGFIGEGLIQGLEGEDGAITAKFQGLGNKIKGLGNVRPDFSGLNSTALHGAFDSGRNGLGNINNSSNKNSMDVTQNIKMYITIPDAKEGATKIAQEFKAQTEISLKNSMVDMFMADAVRN